jgi:hypothetical protein
MFNKAIFFIRNNMAIVMAVVVVVAIISGITLHTIGGQVAEIVWGVLWLIIMPILLLMSLRIVVLYKHSKKQ